MNFHHLRTFVIVADAGGFARASSRLNLTQPAASRQILALEAELGVALFDRIGRRIQLTAEGEDLLRRCRRLLEDAASLGERAHALKAGNTGTLRVGVHSPVRIVPLVHRGAPIGRWAVVTWNPRRFLAPYAKYFITELVASTRRGYPGRNLMRRTPALPEPPSPARRAGTP